MSGVVPAAGQPTRVGFVFLNDGHDWHGGLNYFRSLFLALQAVPGCSVAPVALLGAGSDPGTYGFPANVRVVQHRVFDRKSLPWLLDKLAQRLTGAPRVANAVARAVGIGIVSHGAPTGSRVPCSIGWIPDFQHLHLPRFFPAEELASRDRHYHDLVERCELVVVSSESARADLQRFAPRFAHKARVLRFTAVRPDVDDVPRLDLRAAYGLDGPYFYLPNQVWAHKDHLTAVRALEVLRDAHPRARIVCSGSLKDYRNPDHLAALRAEIERRGLAECFQLLGLVPYAHIAQLMLGAVAVLNPSLFEGWSTTVEEAKALGVPLVLSGIPVHREQCEQGEALFFEPGDAAGMAAAMARLLVPWRGAEARDPSAALAAHRERVLAFARTYERIVAEAAAPAEQA